MGRVPPHYGFETWYCRPGLVGVHEKGGVEGDIGWFRRNHFVPVQEVDGFTELNALVDAWDVGHDQRRIGNRSSTVAEHLAVEQPMLAPLPDEQFPTGRPFTPRHYRDELERCQDAPRRIPPAVGW